MIYLDFLDLVHDKILSSEIDTHPFPHLIFKIDSDKIEFDYDSLEEMKTTSGRRIFNFKLLNNESVAYKLDLIGSSIKNKFNIEIPVVSDLNQIVKYTNYSEIWYDGHELDIQEVHLDYLIKDNLKEDGYSYKSFDINQNTQSVFSMHIYIPDDDEHSDLGTTLYSEPSYELVKDKVKDIEITKENYMSSICSPCDPPINVDAMIVRHHEKLMKKEKIVPFKHGYVFIHETTPHSWHSAPKVPEGYIRKSIMTRWDYTVLIREE